MSASSNSATTNKSLSLPAPPSLVRSNAFHLHPLSNSSSASSSNSSSSCTTSTNVLQLHSSGSSHIDGDEVNSALVKFSEDIVAMDTVLADIERGGFLNATHLDRLEELTASVAERLEELNQLCEARVSTTTDSSVSATSTQCIEALE